MKLLNLKKDQTDLCLTENILSDQRHNLLCSFEQKST